MPNKFIITPHHCPGCGTRDLWKHDNPTISTHYCLTCGRQFYLTEFRAANYDTIAQAELIAQQKRAK